MTDVLVHAETSRVETEAIAICDVCGEPAEVEDGGVRLPVEPDDRLDTDGPLHTCSGCFNTTFDAPIDGRDAQIYAEARSVETDADAETEPETRTGTGLNPVSGHTVDISWMEDYFLFSLPIEAVLTIGIGWLWVFSIHLDHNYALFVAGAGTALVYGMLTRGEEVFPDA